MPPSRKQVSEKKLVKAGVASKSGDSQEVFKKS
jgi:hypothetical protein